MVRPSIAFVKNLGFSEAIVAEVGVKDGANAKTILDMLKPKLLYLIDPYTPYQRSSDEKRCATSLFTDSQQELNSFKEEMLRRIESYDGIVQFLQIPSVEAAEKLHCVSFDFVYIDGNHNKESVKEDIEAWFPLIKPGGVLAGHDTHFEEVMSAVKEFRDKHLEELNFIEMLEDWTFTKK